MPSLDSVVPDGYLDVVDSRTGNKYQIPIHNNAVAAADFARITASKDPASPSIPEDTALQVFDRGFRNTACVESSVTYVSVQYLSTQALHDSK